MFEELVNAIQCCCWLTRGRVSQPRWVMDHVELRGVAKKPVQLTSTYVINTYSPISLLGNVLSSNILCLRVISVSFNGGHDYPA